jgi:hypothetical protein
MPQDPFAQYRVAAPAPIAAPAAPVDPFAEFRVQAPDPARFPALVNPPTPARAEDFMPPAPDNSLGGFLSGAVRAINPLPMIQSIASMTAEEWERAKAAAAAGDYTGALLHAANAHPVTTAGKLALGAGKAQWDQAVKARQAFQQGRYSEAVGHGMAAVTPLVGPAAAEAGEKIGAGDIAGGLGEGVGLIAGVVAPRVAGAAVNKARDVASRGLVRNVNPAEAAAVEWGQAQGIPVDAATATGNPYVRGAQALSEHSVIGSVVGQRARAARETGLATIGEQLAAKAHPAPVSPEQAGTAVREGLTAFVRKRAGQANTAYERLRQIEADPANARTITKEFPEGSSAAAEGKVGPLGRFAAPGASVEDLFQGVLHDARNSGFKGSADDLRVAFYDRVRSARELGASIAEGNEYTPKALLEEIRRLGGIRPFELDFVPGSKTRKMRGEWQSVVEGFKVNHGQAGGSSPFRASGLGVDDLLDRLSPKFKAFIKDERDLKNVLDDIARDPDALKGPKQDLEHLLRGAGVEAGTRWFDEFVKPNTETIQLPVDLRTAKEALTPIYETLMRRYPIAQQQASPGLKAIENIVKGPDYAPLSDVDANLGAIKGIARTDLPELRSVGQGLAAKAVKELDAIVKETAFDAGSGALDALEIGRKATVQKYRAGEILEKLKDEPVKVFKAVTAEKDTGIAQLRRLAKISPEVLPQIGRAYLDDLIGRATAEGGLKHAAAIANDWQRLGPQTKRMLYKPELVSELDKFFLLARKMAESPNPSGSALTGWIAGGVTHAIIHPLTGIPMQLGQGALAQFLNSPQGVRILTQGIRIPSGNKAQAAAWASQVVAFAERNGISLAPAMAADNRESMPGTTVQR